MKTRPPIYKAFTLYCLPLAIGYQLLWGQIFSRYIAPNWHSELQFQATVIKMCSELVIYSAMMIALIKLTDNSNKLLAWLIYCILITVLALTAGALFQLK